MIAHLKIYKSDCFNPYENLATEKYLFENAEDNSMIIYLWQNENTVVIGKNQNPWVECNCALITNEGGFVARRMSGGGAVFHDRGNLNFTFICKKENFSVETNFQIIKKACEYAGVSAEISGRNDILVNTKKFSGNAFYYSSDSAYHHGTILISGNTKKLERYLTPNREKLKSKGVKSVKSRVVNLAEILPDLTAEKFADYILNAAEEILNLKAETIEEIPKKEIKSDIDLFSSWDFIYGKTLPFSLSFEKRYDFGNLQINLNLKHGKIEEIKVFTDALDFTLSEKTEDALLNCEFEISAIEKRLQNKLPPAVIKNILELIKKP